VRFEIAEVRYGADDPSATATEFYQLPVAYRQVASGLMNHAEIFRPVDPELGEGIGYDAMKAPEACRVIMSQLLDRAWHREPGCQVRFHLSGADGLTADLEPHF